LGFESRIAQRLAAPLWLPAAAQGAICIECRSAAPTLAALLEPLHHAPTALRVAAERAVNARLGAGCQVPVAAYATADGEHLHLQALVGNAQSGELLRADAVGTGEELGTALAERLIALGAERVMAGRAGA
jgi:hydroxymethylbilane synthase